MFDIHAYTNPGPRKTNQDFYYSETFDSETAIACLADGVGGNVGGEIASRTAIETFVSVLISNDFDIRLAFNKAHISVIDKAEHDSKLIGMATTLSCCIFDSFLLKGIHTGDSRVCVLRGNGIKQLTEEHTEVTRLIKEGKLSKRDAVDYPRRNVLESAIGGSAPLKIQNFKFDLQKNDRIILTTDGLHGIVSKKEMRDISISSQDSRTMVEKLYKLVETRKPTDNYTFVLVSLI